MVLIRIWKAEKESGLIDHLVEEIDGERELFVRRKQIDVVF